MEFSKSEDLRAIESLAARVFGDAVTDDYHAAADEAGDYDRALWQTLADTGLLGVAVDEVSGGSGLGFSALAAVLEAQGRVLAPVPLLASLVYAAQPIERFGSDAQRRAWLEPMVRGEAHLTAALEEAARGEPGVDASTIAGGLGLNGACDAVPCAQGASVILVPAKTANGMVVAAVAPDASGVALARQCSSAGEAWYHLRLDDVVISADAVLGNADSGEDIVEWMLQRALTGVAALQLGVVTAALERTATYTMERKQFGRPIASFQAVSHRAADGYIDREALRSVVMQAAWRLGDGRDARLQARTAKWWACEAGHRVGHTAQHLHGGIGADVSYPIHRYFLMATQLESVLGGARRQLAAAGELLAGHPDLGVSV